MQQLMINFRPLAHRNDPQTSYDAIPTFEELTRQENKVYAWGIKYQTTAGITAKELASKVVQKGGGTYWYIYHKIQRRMIGLKDKSRAEEFKVGGKQLVRNGCGVWRFI